jgi:superfamily I DNA/RNA helicase
MKPTKEQQAFIDCQEPRILVDAGPGSGKTFALVERIAADQKRGVDPGKQIAITYTVAAANELKGRLIAAGAKTPGFVGTTLALCLRIAKRSRLDLTVMDEEVANQRMKGVCKRLKRNVSDVKKCEFKRTPITNDEIAYNIYYRESLKDGLADFRMLVQWALAEGIHASAVYMDEFQDSSDLEARLVTTADAKIIIVIGDCDQRIFDWRNEGDPYAQIGDEYHRIGLSLNHRSSRNICEAANKIINRKAGRRMVDDRINRPISEEPGQEIVIRRCKNTAEAASVANDLISEAEMLNQSVAVLARLNEQVDALSAFMTNYIEDQPDPKDLRIAESAKRILTQGSTASSEPWLTEHMTHYSTVNRAMESIGWPKSITQMHLTAKQLRLAQLPDVKKISNVHVGTVHSAKGMEFDTVVIHGCNAEDWSRDDLMVFYVALTRARTRVVITYWGEPACFVGML